MVLMIQVMLWTEEKIPKAMLYKITDLALIRLQTKLLILKITEVPNQSTRMVQWALTSKIQGRVWS